MRTLIAVCLFSATSLAAVPRACTGSSTLGTVRIAVRGPKDAAGLPLKSICSIPSGMHLIWDPVHLPPSSVAKGKVAALIIPADGGRLIALKPRPAGTREEWEMPTSPGVVAVIFGPQGLSMGKVESMVARDQFLLNELALRLLKSTLAVSVF